MKFGVAIFPTESVQAPSEIAVMAEARACGEGRGSRGTGQDASRGGWSGGCGGRWRRRTRPGNPPPPVLIGGSGPRVLDRVLAYGDEWMPNRMDDDDLAARIGELGA